MIKEIIKQEMISAMKNKESFKLSTIRLIMAKIKDKEISNRESSSELDEISIVILMQQMVKQRQDSISEYTKAGRQELADKEQLEIDIIRGFMPQQLTEEEIQIAVKEAINLLKPQGSKEIGVIIKYVTEAHAGKVNTAIVAKKVKEILQA